MIQLAKWASVIPNRYGHSLDPRVDVTLILIPFFELEELDVEKSHISNGSNAIPSPPPPPNSVIRYWMAWVSCTLWS
ncbi:2574_t:CDS:2 [Diversispora eburnea]|uniref:2574_t:CDS:1 n=1 Tax=Diversispora eburnea TaxID=1213867 RepID=A0A9N8ZDN4_9GLOM|nr:2574_t:CDS:2 [Diversispora eburnea]